MTATEKRFLAIKDKYLNAFRNDNNFDVYKIWYEKGFVYIQHSDDGYKPSKHRVSQLEQMCAELERRVNNK